MLSLPSLRSVFSPLFNFAFTVLFILPTTILGCVDFSVNIDAAIGHLIDNGVTRCFPTDSISGTTAWTWSCSSGYSASLSTLIPSTELSMAYEYCNMQFSFGAAYTASITGYSNDIYSGCPFQGTPITDIPCPSDITTTPSTGIVMAMQTLGQGFGDFTPVWDVYSLTAPAVTQSSYTYPCALAGDSILEVTMTTIWGDPPPMPTTVPDFGPFSIDGMTSCSYDGTKTQVECGSITALCTLRSPTAADPSSVACGGRDFFYTLNCVHDTHGFCVW